MRLTDNEWEWVSSLLRDAAGPSAAALRAYLDDRVEERLAGAREDERVRIAAAIEEQREQFIRVTGTERAHPIVRAYDDAARTAREGER